MATFKEVYTTESGGGKQDFRYFKPYSRPVHLYWQSVRVTFLQMFPMAGITILNFDHSHSFKDICYVFSGTGHLQLETGKEIPLRRGTICYIDAAVVHRMVSDEDTPLEVFNASFELTPHHSVDKVPPSVAGAEEKFLAELMANRCLSVDDCFHFEDFLHNAIALQNSTAPGEFVKFKNCISNFLITAFQALARLEPGPDEPMVDSSDEEMTMAAMRMVFYMREHYTEGISLADVAKALNYSPRQCQRLIHDFLGVGFTEFVAAHQIRHAKRLLTMTQASMEEVAKSAGFKSSKAFTQQFKALVGVTPNIFRRNFEHRKSIEGYADYDE